MKKHKVLVVVGTRPEAIKMAPLIIALRNNREIFETHFCVTAQHREMLDQVLDIFDVQPDYDLNLMQHNQSLSALTARLVTEFDKVLIDIAPDIVLVHGDTTTAFGSALCAFYHGIKIGHIEAGLRTNNILSPFPEEFNRQAISKMAYWHFAPTEVNKTNLLSEGVPSSNIFVTGNTIVDAMKFILENIGEKFHRLYPNFLVEKISFDVMSSPYILMTCHRRENIGENLIRICEAVLGVSTKFPNIHIILPMHLNPTVRSTILSILGEQKNICLLEPIDYIPFIYLMSHASIIITDSGGIQEEAPSLGKPVLLLRDSTERPEVVSTGAVELVGADKERIISRVSELLLGENSSVDVNTAKINPYGDGCTAEKILSILKENMHV